MTWEEAAHRMQPPLPVYARLEDAYRAQEQYIGDAWGEDLEGFVRAGLVPVDGGYTLTLTAPVRERILRALYLYQPELLFPRVEGPILLAMADRMWRGAPESFREMRRRSVAAVLERRPDARARWFDSTHDIPLIRPTELAADLERTAFAAAWYGFARDIAALAGNASALERPLPDHAGDEGGWTARDLISHLSSTQASMPAVIRARPPAGTPAFDPDRWNASQVARRRTRPVTELVLEARTGAEALAAALGEVELTAEVAVGPFAGRPVRDVMDRMLAHQRAHLAELTEALAR
jgi:hypothetical protein